MDRQSWFWLLWGIILKWNSLVTCPRIQFCITIQRSMNIFPYLSYMYCRLAGSFINAVCLVYRRLWVCIQQKISGQRFYTMTQQYWNHKIHNPWSVNNRDILGQDVRKLCKLKDFEIINKHKFTFNFLARVTRLSKIIRHRLVKYKIHSTDLVLW